MARGKLVSLRLTDDEYDRLVQLGEIHGVDRSTLLRNLVLSAPLFAVWMKVSAGPLTTAYSNDVPSPTAGEDEWIRWLKRRIYGKEAGDPE